MSLIPRLHQLLHLTPQRSLNRRSKLDKFSHGRKNDLSFVITRSDLLAPLKTQVDSLMPYLVGVLRDALGSMGKDVRLGNVRCVSAKRGWWTKELKEDIWKRGGGGWMVGKVNVGKSQLFESVFPKGRRGSIRIDQPHSPTALNDHIIQSVSSELSRKTEVPVIPLGITEKSSMTELYDTNLLLPPLQPETDYPAMPLVSSLPGTTASPIRIPFGDGKGELIDLPGLSRGDLELFVQEPHRPSLVMRSRIRPDQQIIKPGQSLLLGGFIRITPKTPDIIILAYAFTPISAHLTSTEKAIGIQTRSRESRVENIAVIGVGEKIRSAGVFPLKWDVTKQRSGPITAPDAAGIKVNKLPYRVMSTDILIEGCGWVELVAQIRAKALESAPLPQEASGDDSMDDSFIARQWPEVEVFSPEGRFIAARRPLGAWALSGQMKPVARMKSRPRKSMKGMKKKLKAIARTARV
jgi:genetic interactor of prohibitins 3, mitochondrial